MFVRVFHPAAAFYMLRACCYMQHACSKLHGQTLEDCWGWPDRTLYETVFSDLPAKSTVYTPHIFSSGQPYMSGMVRTLHAYARRVQLSIVFLLKPLG
jgi:hypothetical protein